MRGDHLLELLALGVTDAVARALGALEVALEGALDRLEVLAQVVNQGLKEVLQRFATDATYTGPSLTTIALGRLHSKQNTMGEGSLMAALGLLAKWPVATKKLLSLVGGIKARADKKGAEKLKKEFVDDPKMKTIHDPIAERVLRFAKESFVYSVAE